MKKLFLYVILFSGLVFADTPPAPPPIFNSPLVQTGRDITCNVASGSQSGCLSAADWNHFNSATGSPGGSNGSIQYNNSGVFAGFGSWNGTLLALTGNLSVSGTTLLSGAVNAPSTLTVGGLLTSSAGAAFTGNMGFFGTTPITKPSGDILLALANLGLINAPVLQSSDIPNNAANTTGFAFNITATNNATLTTISTLQLPATQITGQLPISHGGTGQTTASAAINALLPSQAGNATLFLQTDGTNISWQAASGGIGTVTSVGLALPSIFNVTGSPVTTNGTLTGILATQTQNTVFSGPAGGAPAVPTFRALVASDIPSLSYVSAITGTAPIISSGGFTPAISITQATTSTNGYLSSTDWNTFNSKQAALTFTSPLLNTSNTITILQATTSTNGYLSSTDWNTFNGKGTGSVTSVALTPPSSIISVSGSPITASGTFTESLVTQSANSFWAGPTTGSAAAPTFRAITPTDVPTLNQSTTGTASNITASSNTTLTSLINLSLAGSQVTGNISGNAANVTGTVAIANGGTGQVTANTALNALLPSQTGNTGFYLQTDGTNTSWTAVAAGGVTSVTATAPIVSSGGANPNITCNVSSSLQPGCLASADWITFNSKQSPLSFTSPLSNISNTVSIPQANSTTSGFLSSTDWNTFNTGSGANKSLSNLNSPTTINQDLLPNAANAFNLGSATYYWVSAYLETINDTSSFSAVDISNRQLDDTVGTPSVDWQLRHLDASDASTAIDFSSSASIVVMHPVSMNGELTLPVGTTSAAPLNIPSGVLLTTPASGSIENDGTSLYYTNSSNARAAVGTVTNVTGTSPVVSSGGATPAISMPAANATTNGYLTSSDWSTFNNKLDASAGNYITNPSAEVDTSGWNLYNNTGNTMPAYVTDQDITYTSTLSGGGGNGATVSYTLCGSSYIGPVVTCPSGTAVQVCWYNGPTLAQNPTATVLKAAYDGTPCAVAIATSAITGTASHLQYITGTATLANGGDTSPTNGTGGVTSGVTFTRNTSTPLVGVASFDLGKTSSSELGQGVSTDFVIDSFDENKTLQISFAYSGSSGMVLGANSDVKVFVYDIGNSALIPVTPLATIAGPVSTAKTFTGLFNATSSSNYRLILHIATANATAWDLLLDSVTVNDIINPTQATQVPSLVLKANPISGAVTDHMMVMWTDGATQWVPATIASVIPTFGTDITQYGFATNIVGSLADIYIRGSMGGFSFGPFVGYEQYADTTAGGISPSPSPFTDQWIDVGKSTDAFTLNIQFTQHHDLITNGSGTPIKGGLLTNNAANNGSGDTVLAVGTNGNFLMANSAAANGIAWTAPVATSPITYTASTHTFALSTVPVASGGTGLTTTSQNFAFVGPTSGSGAPTFRALVAGDIPTLNQNTTGSAAKWTTARNLAGNSVDGSANVAFANKFVVQGTTDAGLSAAQFLGALTTGIVKNTTTTGVLSIAVAADFPTLNQNTTGTAANVTGTVAIANGGTGQTTAANAINALLPTQTGNNGKFLTTNGTSPSWATASGSGTVTSVAMTVPSWLTVTGSPITTSGTLAVTGTSETANFFLAAPNGSSGAMTPRAIVATDIPTLNQSTTGTASDITTSANTSLTSLVNLATVGTITSGTWSGSTVLVAHGGTGDTSFTAYAPVIGGTTTTGALQSASSGMSNVGFCLTSTGTSSAPTWQSCGGGGANTALSNLTTTSINQDLVPTSDEGQNLGSASNRWGNVFIAGLVDTSTIQAVDVTSRFLDDSIGATSVDFQGRQLFGPTAYILDWNSGNLLTENSASTSGTQFLFNNTDTGGKGWLVASTGSLNTGGAGILGFVNTTDDPANYKLYIKPTGEVVMNNALLFGLGGASQPTLGLGCGVGATLSVNASNATGTISLGTGNTVPCTLTFSSTWASTPHCFGNDQGTATIVRMVPSTTTVDFNMSASDGDLVDYLCVGEQ